MANTVASTLIYILAGAIILALGVGFLIYIDNAFGDGVGFAIMGAIMIILFIVYLVFSGDLPTISLF